MLYTYSGIAVHKELNESKTFCFNLSGAKVRHYSQPIKEANRQLTLLGYDHYICVHTPELYVYEDLSVAA